VVAAVGVAALLLLSGGGGDDAADDLAGATGGESTSEGRPGTEDDERGPETPVLDQARLVVPTGLEAVPSEAGVQLEWSSGDGGEYPGPFAVLVLSEQDAPRVEMAVDRPSLLIPAVDLRPDNGYCFGVARLDTIDEISPGRGADVGGYDVGAAYSEMVCIRGATEDTVRTD
jgi:hypothetical protein